MSDRDGDSGSIFTSKKHPHLARYFFIKTLVLQPQQNMARIRPNENIDGNKHLHVWFDLFINIYIQKCV